MSDRVHDYFQESDGPGHFQRVIALHEETHIPWEKLNREIPTLSRGWFELSRLSKEDRIEFTRGYWLSKLGGDGSDELNFHDRLNLFFDKLEDVALFATQEMAPAPYELHMVYCLKENSGFFHGSPPATPDILHNFSKQFGNYTFPNDYLAFFSIHDGFSKYTDTGLIKTRDMARNYLRFQEINAGKLFLGPEGQMLDPASLIPFYESFVLHCHQCFCADWYPAGEMGNLYYSELEDGLSDFLYHITLDDHYAFTTFLGWLMSYLEGFGHL
jgi:hypothetical protein